MKIMLQLVHELTSMDRFDLIIDDGDSFQVLDNLTGVTVTVHYNGKSVVVELLESNFSKTFNTAFVDVVVGGIIKELEPFESMTRVDLFNKCISSYYRKEIEVYSQLEYIPVEEPTPDVPVIPPADDDTDNTVLYGAPHISAVTPFSVNSRSIEDLTSGGETPTETPTETPDPEAPETTDPGNENPETTEPTDPETETPTETPDPETGGEPTDPETSEPETPTDTPETGEPTEPGTSEPETPTDTPETGEPTDPGTNEPETPTDTPETGGTTEPGTDEPTEEPNDKPSIGIDEYTMVYKSEFELSIGTMERLMKVSTRSIIDEYIEYTLEFEGIKSTNRFPYNYSIHSMFTIFRENIQSLVAIR